MGSTFVTLGRDESGRPAIGDRQMGYWMRDPVLELWLRLLALHIKDPDAEGDLSNTIRNHWLFASRQHFMGCVPHYLEEATSTAEGFDLVRDAVNSLSAALASGTDSLSGGTLNLLGFESEWGDADRALLQDVADKFKDLLTVRPTPEDGISKS
jgi:hypothetical protein